METVRRDLGETELTGNGGERFTCPRCAYARPLRHGEDGFRIYILHEQRCNPAVGGQIWLPFITEDDTVWPSEDDKAPALLDARRQSQANRKNESCPERTAGLHSRKAA